jgi:hypothetical protein
MIATLAAVQGGLGRAVATVGLMLLAAIVTLVLIHKLGRSPSLKRACAVCATGAFTASFLIWSGIGVAAVFVAAVTLLVVLALVVMTYDQRRYPELSELTEKDELPPVQPVGF